MSEIINQSYKEAKESHKKYWDTTMSACLNAVVVLGVNLNESERIIIVWHILDRLKSEGWIDERKET